MGFLGAVGRDGVWRRCTFAQPQCTGQAAQGCCTCLPRQRWCKCGKTTVPVKGMLCIYCANKALGLWEPSDTPKGGA
jgi:hypothetical protein